MSNPNGSPASEGASMSELLQRVMASENHDLRTCLVADLNAWMASMALLTGRTQADPDDLFRLLSRFRLTLSALRPSPAGATSFAPPSRRADIRDVGLDAVSREVERR